MATLGIATLETNVDLKGLDKGLTQARVKTKSGFKASGDLAATALKGAVVTAAAVATKAIIAFVDDSVAEFQAFEKGASEVFTLMPGMSEKAMQSMKDDVLDFAVDAGRTVEDTLGALYQAISAGVPADNVFDFMQIASDAALGGVTDLETAVDGITSVVNAYGDSVIDAATASDVMFTAVKLGKTDFEQLSHSLFNVVPTAASLGVTFTDVAANLAALTAQGTPTSVATTQLRAALVEASKSGTKLDLALQRLTGKTFAELIASGRTSSEIFSELRDSMPEQDFRNLFSSVEAANAVLGLTNDTAAGIIDTFGTVEDTLGATAEAAETMAQSMEHLEATTEAASEALKIQIGEALSPLERAWLETKLGVSDYLSEDLKLRQQLLRSSDALAEYGYSGESLRKALGALGEGTTYWRDSLVDADTMARRTAVAIELLDRGFRGSADELGKLVTQTIEERDSAFELGQTYETTDQLLTNYVRTTENAAEKQAELARIQQQEAATAAMKLGEQTETVDRLLTNYIRTAEVAAEQEELLAVAQEEEAEAARVAAEAQREHEAALGGYFDAAINATGETKSLERQLYDTAVASGAGAAELAILAANTGEFTQAEIDAAFQAALMQSNIDTLVASMQAGNITAEQATEALSLLKDGTYDTAAAALNYVENIDSATEAMSTASLAADDLTAKINELPTQKNFTYVFKTDMSGFTLPPDVDPGDVKVTAGAVGMARGGFTSWAGVDEIAGLVHGQELVIPAPTLRAGAGAILEFAEMNTPTGMVSGGFNRQAMINDNRQFTWNVQTAGFNPESSGRAAAAFALGGI